MKKIKIGRIEFEIQKRGYAFSNVKHQLGSKTAPEYIAVKVPTDKLILLGTRNGYFSIEYVYKPSRKALHPNKQEWYVYKFSESLCRL